MNKINNKELKDSLKNFFFKMASIKPVNINSLKKLLVALFTLPEEVSSTLAREILDEATPEMVDFVCLLYNRLKVARVKFDNSKLIDRFFENRQCPAITNLEEMYPFYSDFFINIQTLNYLFLCPSYSESFNVFTNWIVDEQKFCDLLMALNNKQEEPYIKTAALIIEDVINEKWSSLYLVSFMTKFLLRIGSSDILLDYYNKVEKLIKDKKDEKDYIIVKGTLIRHLSSTICDRKYEGIYLERIKQGYLFPSFNYLSMINSPNTDKALEYILSDNYPILDGNEIALVAEYMYLKQFKTKKEIISTVLNFTNLAIINNKLTCNVLLELDLSLKDEDLMEQLLVEFIKCAEVVQYPFNIVYNNIITDFMSSWYEGHKVRLM